VQAGIPGCRRNIDEQTIDFDARRYNFWRSS